MGLRAVDPLSWVSVHFKQMFYGKLEYRWDRCGPEEQTRVHLKEKIKVFLRRWNSMSKCTEIKKKMVCVKGVNLAKLTVESCPLHSRLGPQQVHCRRRRELQSRIQALLHIYIPSLVLHLEAIYVRPPYGRSRLRPCWDISARTSL